MSRYDGLIIPRSYSEYINKTDAATLLQALQLSGVMDNAPTAGSNKPVKSSGLVPVDTVTLNNMQPITSNAVYNQLSGIKIKQFSITIASVTAGETYFKSYTDIGLDNNIAVLACAVEFIGGSSGFDYSGCLYFRDVNKQVMYKCAYTQQNLRIYGVIFYT